MADKPEMKWIPFTMREITEEEKEYFSDWDYILDCPLPENYEEILVSNGKYVWVDTFYNDGECSLESDNELEGLAWMPMPKPWRKDD